MDNNGDSISSSGQTPPPVAMIMPPLPADGPESDEAAARGLENPSSVRNLKDILKFTTEMTASCAKNADADRDDAENAGAKSEEAKKADGGVDKDKMKYLTNVLSSMSVNVQEEIKNLIDVLLDPQKSEKDYITALGDLIDYVDNLDFANDFQKLGGFQVFEPGLKSDYLRVRVRTAHLIATVLQLNPYCQNKFIEQPNYIKLLMTMIEREDESVIRVKALHAVSSCVRNNVDAFWKFIEYGGDKLIVFALKSFTHKLMVKAVFFVSSTCKMDSAITELYLKLGVVELLCTTIMYMEGSLEHIYHELLLSTLNELLGVSPVRVKEICLKFNEFKTALLNLRDSYPYDIEYEELRNQIDLLMSTLNL